MFGGEEGMAEKKGGRNILDITNGFHVMVNFYIMRYMYSHMDDKADGFCMEDGLR